MRQTALCRVASGLKVHGLQAAAAHRVIDHSQFVPKESSPKNLLQLIVKASVDFYVKVVPKQHYLP